MPDEPTLVSASIHVEICYQLCQTQANLNCEGVSNWVATNWPRSEHLNALISSVYRVSHVPLAAL